MKKKMIGDIVTITKGRKAQKVFEEELPNAVRYIQIEDLRTDNKMKFTADTNGIFVSEKDLCIAWDGANAGTVGYGLTGMIGSTIARLCITDSDIYAPYIGCFLQSKFKILNGRTTGTTIPHVERGRLEELEFPYIPLPEQRRVVAMLDRAGAIWRNRHHALKLLDDFLKSVFLNMFSVTSDSDLITLQQCCKKSDDIKCGPFGTQLNKSEYTTSGVPIWGIPQVNSKFKKHPTDFVSLEKARKLEAFSVRRGDIVMSRKGNVGTCAVYPDNYSVGIVHSDVLRIRVDQKIVNPIFLCCKFAYDKKIQQQVSIVSSGAIMPGINVNKLKNIVLSLPDIQLQNKFSSFSEKLMQTLAKMSKQEIDASQMVKALQQTFF